MNGLKRINITSAVSPNGLVYVVIGDDEEDAYRQLCQIVDEWIKIFEEDGRPLPIETANRSYSGKFMLRLDPDLHKQLAIHTAQHGVSLNKYCTQHLEQAY